MLFKPKNEVEKETIATEPIPFNKKKFQQLFNYIFENKNRFSMLFVDMSLKIQISLFSIMDLFLSNYTMRKPRPLIKYYQFYIYMPPKNKMKQKQKQKQSHNLRQTVTVNIQQKTQRRPVRRTGTRTPPLVHYQQVPIHLAPAIDYGKLEHQIASINNTILHNLKNNQRTNDVATAPPINRPVENVNLMSGLAAAERQSETEQKNNDAQLARHQQQRAYETPESQKST